MTRVADKTVLITGAALGMGRLHAERACQRGAGRLVLWDIRSDALEQTADDLRRQGATVDTAIVDISDADAIEEAARQTLGTVGPVHVIFNNAGVVVPGDFLQHQTKDIEQIIRINTLGVMHVARAFLPSMIESPEAHLVNISSASALMPLPYGSVYAASKWAVYGWSESVRLELEENHPHVRVTTICPSFVATGMFEGVKPPWMTRFLTTEEIVDAIWKGLEANAPIVIAPFIARTALPMRALLPTRAFDWLGRHFFRVYSSMKGLKGRSKSPAPAAKVASSAR